MTVTLAHRLAVAMLVTALCAGPVSASVPSCCAKAATTGGKTSCCCAAKKAAETKSCCTKAKKSCCAHEEAAPEADTADDAQHAGLNQSKSSCCCKARLPQPAISESQVRSEQDSKSTLLNHDSYAVQVVPHVETRLLDAKTLQVPAGPGVQVLLCRWLI